MQQDKKKIILDEIDHWRRGRLLPEQYCDFLENLYSDQQDNSRKNRSLFEYFKMGNLKLWFLCFGIISFICFIGLYFSSFPWSLQIASIFFVTTFCYGIAGVFRKHGHTSWGHMGAAAGSLLMLAMGAAVIHIQGVNDQFWVLFLIFICSLTWCLVGYWLNMSLLQYCGFLGWAALYGKLSAFTSPEISWIEVELRWLPLSVLGIGLSWLLHDKFKRLSPVLFAVGVTLWFMPQADVIFLRGETPQDQLFGILIKALIALVLFYVLRKKWIVWVSS